MTSKTLVRAPRPTLSVLATNRIHSISIFVQIRSSTLEQLSRNIIRSIWPQKRNLELRDDSSVRVLLRTPARFSNSRRMKESQLC